jgi:hypothetical protein
MSTRRLTIWPPWAFPVDDRVLRLSHGAITAEDGPSLTKCNGGGVLEKKNCKHFDGRVNGTILRPAPQSARGRRKSKRVIQRRPTKGSVVH